MELFQSTPSFHVKLVAAIGSRVSIGVSALEVLGGPVTAVELQPKKGSFKC